MTDADASGGSKPELRFVVCGAADAAAFSFETDTRRFVGFDMPDGGRYTRNWFAEAASADLALVLADARTGVSARTRRHLYIAALAGVRRAILAVDNVDLLDCGGDAFAAISEECRGFARELGIDEVDAVPLSARAGEDVFAAPWHDGPTLMKALEGAEIDRGDTAAERERPTRSADQFAVHLVWTGAEPMLPGRPYAVRFAGASAVAQVTDLTHRVEVETLRHLAAKTLAANQIGYCKIALDRPVPFDTGAAGAFELADRFSGATVGAGAIRFALRRASNIAWQETGIDKAARARAIGQRPCVVWLTGLPGAGKSTVADLVERKLQAAGRHTYLLDGNNLRHGLNRDLGFTDRDRVENIRRVAEVAKLMVDAGLIVIVALISPFRSERAMARGTMEEGEFFEVFVDTPVEVCEARDPRGLYAKARRGELANFTGIDSPYEAPETPDLRIDTTALPADRAADEVLRLLRTRGSRAGDRERSS
ncbi:MAG: adenylyl-sulfate kinase [Defluviicoccus sp.]|nr:adenylyl-sulfate kinase [Defluviicoccus sp.]MDE0385517.1 adenylyl-sulfate kinase [Defluviicoccus sp.]